MKNNLFFNDVSITNDQVVEAALRHTGCEYCDDFNLITEIAGKKSGKCNCYGVLLSTARDLGLVDPDFDLNLTWKNFKMDKPKIMWQIIHNNFIEVPKGDQSGRPLVAPADVLLQRWHDQDSRLQAVHHVAIHVGHRHDEPYGMMLHALDAESGGQDKIYVQRISELDWERIDSIWRLKGLA